MGKWVYSLAIDQCQQHEMVWLVDYYRHTFLDVCWVLLHSKTSYNREPIGH